MCDSLRCPPGLRGVIGPAAHVPGVAAIEANARQYYPNGNAGWEKRFPGIFRVTDGTMETACLDGPGLGAGEPLPSANDRKEG